MRQIFLFILIVIHIEANTFKDNDTGLEWQDDFMAKQNEQYWENAKNYCYELVLNGKKDWRLPNVIELLTIFDVHRHPPYIRKGFQNISKEEYWTSTEYYYPHTDKIKAAFIIDFGVGNVYERNFEYKRNVRCVRGNKIEL